ncbi:MAG: hypothetical protein J5525_00905 [Lachnospiraceae bacterium]|nr:hypothetical protein [Lachnospiraceae bacterium]
MAVTVILFFVLIVSFIWLLINLFNVLHVRTKILSKHEMRKEVQKQAKRLRLKDPIISCDYCGCRIDTKKEEKCPGCGASYNLDEEWLKRHEVSEEDVDKNSDKVNKSLETKNSTETKEAKRKLLISGCVTAVIFALFCISGKIAYRYPETRKSEELNNGKSYHQYAEADYSVKDDGIVYEDDDVTIKITGIYHADHTYDDELYGHVGDVKVGFLISNRTDEDLQIVCTCNSISGITREWSYIFFNNIFKKNSDTVIYEEVYSAPEQRISELVFSEIIIRYDDPSKDVDTNDPVVVSTTAENKEILDKEDFILLYSNEKVDIYKHYSEKKAEETCDLIIYNKTDASMSMECDGVTADNKEVKNPYIFYGKYVPPHYAFVANYYHAFNKEYGDTKGKDVQSSFTFKFREDPQMSFSTGYFDM